MIHFIQLFSPFPTTFRQINRPIIYKYHSSSDIQAQQMNLRSRNSQNSNQNPRSISSNGMHPQQTYNNAPPSMRPVKNIRKMMKEHDNSMRDQEASSPSQYFPFSHQSQQFMPSSSQLPPPSSSNILPTLFGSKYFPPSHIVKESSEQSVQITPPKVSASSIDPKIRARTREKVYGRLRKNKSSKNLSQPKFYNPHQPSSLSGDSHNRSQNKSISGTRQQKINIKYTNNTSGSQNNNNSMRRNSSHSPEVINPLNLLKPAYYSGITRAIESSNSPMTTNSHNHQKIQYSQTVPLQTTRLQNPSSSETNRLHSYMMNNSNSVYKSFDHSPPKNNSHVQANQVKTYEYPAPYKNTQNNNNSANYNNISSTVYHSILNNNSSMYYNDMTSNHNTSHNNKTKTMSPLQQDNLYRATMGLANTSEPVYEKNGSKRIHKNIFDYANHSIKEEKQESNHNIFLLEQQKKISEKDSKNVFLLQQVNHDPQDNNSKNYDRYQDDLLNKHSFQQQFPSQIISPDNIEENQVSPLRTPVFATSRESQVTYFPPITIYGNQQPLKSLQNSQVVHKLQQKLINHSNELVSLRTKIQELLAKQENDQCHLLKELIKKEEDLCTKQEEINRNLEQVVTLQAINNMNHYHDKRYDNSFFTQKNAKGKIFEANNPSILHNAASQKEEQIRREKERIFEDRQRQNKMELEEEQYIRKQLEKRRKHRLDQIAKENQKIYEEIQRRRNKYQGKIKLVTTPIGSHNAEMGKVGSSNENNESYTLAFNQNNVQISALYPNNSNNSNDDTLGQLLSPFAVNPYDF